MLSHLHSANLLVIGPAFAANEFLTPLLPSLGSPVVFVDGAKPDLPTGPVGTIVVRNVARLTPPHQDEFLEWLDAERRHARIITIAARSLFPKVQRREFSERLYYRLNTIVVPLRPVGTGLGARGTNERTDR